VVVRESRVGNGTVTVLRGPRTRIEQAIMFGAGGNAATHQLYGWSGGENGFTWTDGTEAALTFRNPRAPHGGFIEISATPFGPQRLIMKINGYTIWDQVIEYGLSAAYPFDAPDDDNLTLTLEVPDARWPGEPGGGRRIALAVRSVLVSSLTESAASIPQMRSAVEIDRTDDAAALQSAEAITNMPAAVLASQFEKLIGNCEFGFFQRRCGAEPISLLRFADSHPQQVYEGLMNEFAGLGDDLRVEPSDDFWGEWMTFDPRYDLRLHTFIKTGTIPHAKMLGREIARFRLLRDKLLDEVDGARKVFVVSWPGRLMRLAESVVFALALSRRAPSTVLFVARDVPDMAAGSVELWAPGVLRAHIREKASATTVEGIPLRAWLEICVNAWLLCRADRVGALAGQ
jgi:hypothetical protein